MSTISTSTTLRSEKEEKYWTQFEPGRRSQKYSSSQQISHVQSNIIQYRYAAPSHLGGTRTWQLRRARRRLSQGCHRHLSSTLASTAMDCGTGRSRATTERAKEMENNTDTPVPRVSAPRHPSAEWEGSSNSASNRYMRLHRTCLSRLSHG